jgi:hypothetical protein
MHSYYVSCHRRVKGAKKLTIPIHACNQTDGKKKKSKRGGGPKPIKKKDPTTGGTVTITRMSRNKRKSVTVVTGLDTYSGIFFSATVSTYCIAFSVDISMCHTFVVCEAGNANLIFL